MSDSVKLGGADADSEPSASGPECQSNTVGAKQVLWLHSVTWRSALRPVPSP
ncbi:MAG: hypothetical protein RQ847_07845 [Wenzhouxiangellaceae bacterium]|nr:hypothetical protein [Wenzhouxiangellaceae bacterium]